MTNPEKKPSEEIPPHSEELPPKERHFKEKFQDSLKDFQSNKNINRLMDQATENTRDTVSYVILIVGIVLLFFNPIYGGVLVGLVSGFYFAPEIISFWQNINDFVEDAGIVKSLIGLGFLLALFISAPALFIALIFAVIVRQVLFPETQG
jgi:hypothetical protein